MKRVKIIYNLSYTNIDELNGKMQEIVRTTELLKLEARNGGLQYSGPGGLQYSGPLENSCGEVVGSLYVEEVE